MHKKNYKFYISINMIYLKIFYYFSNKIYVNFHLCFYIIFIFNGITIFIFCFFFFLRSLRYFYIIPFVKYITLYLIFFISNLTQTVLSFSLSFSFNLNNLKV